MVQTQILLTSSFPDYLWMLSDDGMRCPMIRIQMAEVLSALITPGMDLQCPDDGKSRIFDSLIHPSCGPATKPLLESVKRVLSSSTSMTNPYLACLEVIIRHCLREDLTHVVLRWLSSSHRDIRVNILNIIPSIKENIEDLENNITKT